MRTSFQKSLIISFICAFLVLVAVAFLSYANMSAMIEANRWVSHSQQVINQLESVLDSVKEIEVGDKGFNITSDENFFKSYEEGVSEATLSLDKLNSLTSDDAEVQQQFHHLRKTMEDFLGLARLDMANKVPGHAIVASAKVDHSKEEKLATQVRTIAREMLDAEHKLLDQRTETVSRKAQNTQTTIFALSLLSIVMLTGSFIFARRDSIKRRAAERATQEANEQLNLWVEELEKRNNEVGFLNEVIEVLQMCAQPVDAFSAIEKSMSRMYPNAAGALYLFNNSRNLLEEAAQWNGHQGEQVFIPEDCCALRSGHAHLVREPSAALLCRHLVKDVTGPTKCLPLTAHGEVLGLLHIQMGPMSAQEIEQDFRTSRRSFLASVVDHFAMSLANLKLRETLRAQSIRDALTGLFNRRHMEASLEREIRRAMRKNTTVGVLVADLDHFKNFNDTFGHDAGDALLREAAHILGSTVRGEDIVCRFGGEEFVLILPDVNPEIAMSRAESLREAVSRLNIVHSGQTLGKVTMSIGVALFPAHGRDSQSVMKASDKALFLAKSSGRDRVLLADATIIASDVPTNNV